MKAHTFFGLASAALIAIHPLGVQAQTCDGKTERRLDQEHYLALTDRVYAHAPDINSFGQSGGWQAFNLNVLVGTYRKPFLLPSALLKESDLKALLARRPDITTSVLKVSGADRNAAAKAGPQAAAITVKDGEKPVSITVRVTRVVPVSGGTDHLFLTCTARP